MFKKTLLLSLALIIFINILPNSLSLKTAYAADQTCEQQCAGLKQIGSSGQRDVQGESYKCCIESCGKKSTDFGLCIGIDNPLGDKKDVKDIIAAILKTIAEIVLPIVIVMVIYSGFLYVLARGNSEAIERAHKTLTWTLIGAAILLGAQLIANVLIDTVSSIGKDSGYTNTTSTTKSNTTTNSNSNINNNTNGNLNNNNTILPSYITNLNFTKTTENNTSISGIFSFNITNPFTPDANSFSLICAESSGTGAVTLMENLSTTFNNNLTIAPYKTKEYTIKNNSNISVNNNCYMTYKLGGIPKNSNIINILVPSKIVDATAPCLDSQTGKKSTSTSTCSTHTVDITKIEADSLSVKFNEIKTLSDKMIARAVEKNLTSESKNYFYQSFNPSIGIITYKANNNPPWNYDRVIFYGGKMITLSSILFIADYPNTANIKIDSSNYTKDLYNLGTGTRSMGFFPRESPPEMISGYNFTKEEFTKVSDNLISALKKEIEWLN